jgi:HTH-type transcriptional regulator/antitoxin HipB
LRNEYLAFIRQKNIFEKRGSRVMRQLINTTAQLAEIIRGRRKVRRISQAELATKLGITQGRFSALEADPSSLPLARLILLVKLLGLELIIRDKADEPASKAQW